jgi:hypothetical protein
MRWISVVVLGTVMTGVFFLAGGFGSSPSVVALAGNASAPVTSSPRVISISLNVCAGTTLSGAVGVADKFTGKLTLGLFALEPSPQHLTRQFVDTTQRATAAFSHALLAPFSFTVPAVKAPAYEVVVLPPTGKITATTTLVESQAVPLCNTQTVTTTATDTQTVTTTSTVTMPPSGDSTIIVSVTGTRTSTSTVNVYTTYFTTTIVTSVV